MVQADDASSVRMQDWTSYIAWTMADIVQHVAVILSERCVKQVFFFFGRNTDPCLGIDKVAGTSVAECRFARCGHLIRLLAPTPIDIRRLIIIKRVKFRKYSEIPPRTNMLH